jgi:hypothetical protein
MNHSWAADHEHTARKREDRITAKPEAMLVSEARVETEHSSRYLVQLCRHLHKIAQRQPEMGTEVESADDHGIISFGWGQCILRAHPGLLMLRAEASDEADLRRLRHRVSELLERFGRGEQLTVSWTPRQNGAEQRH